VPTKGFPWEKTIPALERWYGRHARPLPWRQTSDPYAIWLSEVMLQQTRVETATPYWRLFLERWPTVESLARATPAQVLKAWEGLGYYARARRLPEAARAVVARGGWPRTAAELARLPGVGRYTAGAIASIAFGEAAPVLDGNVRRVWARLFAVTSPPVGKALDRFWLWSARVAASGEPAVVNQALMELGATVCTPRAPACGACPLRRWCLAAGEGRPEAYPKRAPKKAVPQVRAAVGLLWKRGRFLIALRPDDGLLGGLWELPGGKVEPGENPEAALARELEEELGARVAVGAALPPVRHAYSHFKVLLHPFDCALAAGSPPPRAPRPLKWILPRDIPRYAFPAATLRIFARRFGPQG